MAEKSVIDKVRRYAEIIRQRVQVEEIFLYGSQATGEPDADSDIDVAVVLKEVPEQNWLELEASLFRLGWDIDLRIEPLLFVEGRDRSGFLRHIRSSGIKIY